MKNTLRSLATLALTSLLTLTAVAQVATGTPGFGSFSAGPDVTNLGNLNVHFSLPIFSRPGRGMSFSYALGYDTSVWVPVTIGSSHYWTFQNGWVGQTQVLTGYINYRSHSSSCYSHNVGDWVTYTEYDFDAYIDQAGTPHSLGGTAIADEDCAPNWNLGVQTITTSDGSGISAYVTSYKDDYGNSVVEDAVYTRTRTIYPPLNDPSACFCL